MSATLNKVVNPEKNSELKSTSPRTPPLAKALIIWGFASLFYLYEYVLRVSPSVMTNELMAHFNVTSTALGVLASFYYYSYVMLQLPGGIIVDRLGARAVITVSAGLCVIGSYLFATSETLAFAQLGRFLIGAGSACAFLSSMKLAAEWFHPSKFALLCGLVQAMGTVGGTFGGKPFAMLINQTSWQEGMVLLSILGFIIMILSWTVIRNRPPKEMAYHHVTQEEGSFLQGLKLIASNPKNWIIGLYGGLMYILISGFTELWSVPYLMELYGINNEKASSAIIMLFIGYAIGCPSWAVLSDRWNSRRKIMLLSSFNSLVVFLVIIYVPMSFELMNALLFVAGFVCSGQTVYFAAAQDINPPQISGTCVGFTNFFVMMSGVIFQPALGKLLDLTWEGTMRADGLTRLYSINCFRSALTSIPICLILSMIVIWFYKENTEEKIKSI